MPLKTVRERERQWVDDTQDWGRAKNQRGRSERERERVSGLMTLKTGAEQRTNKEGQRQRETVG